MPAKTRTSKRGGSSNGSSKRGAKALRGNPFVAVVETVREEVDQRLRGLLDAKVDAAAENGPEVVAMVSALRELCLRGGKRLRAALVVAGYRAVSATADLEPALDAGVAIELLHAYFLIHDDWMDGDDMRRGGPSVHAMLAERYRSPVIGAHSAILAGDFGVALATEALSRVDVPPARLPRVLAAFAQMQIDAVAGQQLDILSGAADVEKTYVLKTVSYTVAGPLRLGALLAGGSAELIGDLERFAHPAGVAFQLRDDLLSVFGDPRETGKPFANDIRNGKRTLLIERALELGHGKDRALLEKAWGKTGAKQKDLERVVEMLDRCGAKRAVEERIAELSNRSRDVVASGRLSEPSQRLLVGAVDALVERQN